MHPVQSLTMGGSEREPWWKMKCLLLIRLSHNPQGRVARQLILIAECQGLGVWPPQNSQL